MHGAFSAPAWIEQWSASANHLGPCGPAHEVVAVKKTIKNEKANLGRVDEVRDSQTHIHIHTNARARVTGLFT